MRWVSLGAGIALIVLAFAAATQVADTREGLIAEVITLLAGLAGLSLLLYGLIGRTARSAPRVERPPQPKVQQPAVRPVTDLLAGGGGIVIAVVLLGGLAITGGFEPAGLGLVILLPMLAGSIYLCVRFVRAPARDWKVDLRRPGREKQS
jgi:predicted lipid-binding transport protein (Tim44 family)